jgi:phage shock protein C
MALPPTTQCQEEIAMTLGDDLNKLEELRARGALTDEEFTRAKERLLNTASTNTASTNSSAPFVSAVNTFRRSRTDRWIAGVCGGLGRLTGMESWVWRLFFTVLFLCAGTGLLVYILLAIFVPSD